MTNEIKEILEDLDFNVNHTKDWLEPLGLNQDTWKALLDYITNLQEENKNLQQRIDKAIKYINEITYCEFDNLYMEYGDDLTPEYIIKILKGDE